MTDHQNVLHAILADPTDDLSRSAYADILEESGGDPEYVEFIRTPRVFGGRNACDDRLRNAEACRPAERRGQRVL